MYDLYYLLKNPNRVQFEIDDETYLVESVEGDGSVIISFNGKWYRDRDDFFSKATIGDTKLTSLYFEIGNFEVL